MSMAAAKPMEEVAAKWRDARKLYVIYSALQEQFALGLSSCRDLDSPIDRTEPEAIQRITQWFLQMDERTHVHQLRQLLQTSRLGTEENLRLLVHHYLGKESKDENDRDKIDFILVQYLSSCAPPGFYEREVSFDEIAGVLEPILGEVGLHPPQWLAPIEQATQALEHFHSLRDLFGKGTLEQIRELKVSAGDMYFGPTALAAITRFNFLVRRTFVRLIAADLHSIRFSLNELEKRGIATVDCARAGLSTKEPLENLRQICQEWKKPFRAAYAAGQNFKELIEIRGAVEEALLDVPGANVPGHAHAPAAALEQDGETSARDQIGETHEINGVPPAVVPQVELQVESIAQRQPAAQPLAAPHAAVQASAPAAQAAAPPAPKAEVLPPQVNASETSKTAASAPAVKTPSSATPAPSAASEVQAVMQVIAKELGAANAKAGAVASVAIDGVKVALASWEVAAFLKPGDEISEALRHAVGARALLTAEIGRRKRGTLANGLRSAVKTGELESARIQARVAVSRQSKDVDATVNLSATGKRLLALLEEAEKFAK